MVLHDGALCAYFERGGKSVVTFGTDHAAWAAALVERKVSGRVKRVELTKIDGVPVREHAAAAALRAVGFVDSYRGLLLP